MNVLEKLLGGVARVRLIRYFLLNPDSIVTPAEVAHFVRIARSSVLRECKFLASLGLVKKAARTDEAIKDSKHSKKKVKGMILASDFPLLDPLRHLTIAASPAVRERMVKKFKLQKTIRLVVLGGIFVNGSLGGSATTIGRKNADIDTQLDLLIVADKLKRKDIEVFIDSLNAEIGKELSWALLNVAEFEYRRAMHDKFLRDLFDYYHELLINKLGVE